MHDLQPFERRYVKVRDQDGRRRDEIRVIYRVAQGPNRIQLTVDPTGRPSWRTTIQPLIRAIEEIELSPVARMFHPSAEILEKHDKQSKISRTLVTFSVQVPDFENEAMSSVNNSIVAPDSVVLMSPADWVEGQIRYLVEYMITGVP